MGSLNPSPELTLDLKPSFIPKTISQFLGGMSRIGSVTEKVLQVDDFVDRLETETRKIEAFERELPLCMLLINDAIVALKEVSMVLKKSSNAEPVLEEFIPLKNSCDDDAKVESIIKKDSGDKKNWLSSTQLWNTNENIIQIPNATIKKRAEEEDCGKAFFFPEIKNPMRENGLLTEINGDCRLTQNVQSNIQTSGTAGLPPHQQTSRKQRRCWSTELHRRFVNALQQLGGSHAATPKQIRELMQVDGLTNDEVKSHLQKYRLHTRRFPSSNTNQSGVVLGGGLWMPPQDQYVGSSKCSNSQSGSPDGPLPNGGNTMDDEEDEKSENYCWTGNL
ncbi:transcription factor NIGTH1-like isoform X1 [Cynara cardunculus var. scolymus]|uniref:transcription factor NIGTH1-like isoform X1 n=1 Tax=Cynara cardunculus var. scolymus TaxID=59895 RepID=UPI000D62DCAD|nr:transcription factor NIGTH1-like isoform X1 [Cynara cardunculus var. scolymus]